VNFVACYLCDSEFEAVDRVLVRCQSVCGAPELETMYGAFRRGEE
jgi:hypothetical protein